MPRIGTSRTAVSVALVSSIVLASTAVHAGTLKVMFTGRANNPALNKLVQQYQKTHHGTKITPVYMEWRDQAAAIAQKPDVYVGDRWFLSDNIDIGLFEDLNKLLPLKSVREVHKELLYSCTLGKRIYGVPVLGYSSVLNYNKISFKNVGLAAPDSTWTWQGKFYEACKKLTRDSNGDGNMESQGIVGLPGDGLATIVHSFGGSFVDKAFRTVLYTEKPAMDAINFILKIHQEKLAELQDWSSVEQDNPKSWPFYNGKSAMQINMDSTLKTQGWADWLKQSKVTTLDPGSAVVPAGPKGPVPLVDSSVVAMMVTCKNKREAADFINYAIDIKGQKLFYDVLRGLPTTDVGLTMPAVAKDLPAPFLRAYRMGRGRHLRRQVYEVEGTLWNDLANIVRGDGTMKDLLENAKGRATDTLANIS